MLEDNSNSASSVDLDEFKELFAEIDLEDILTKATKQPMTVKEECEAIQKLRSENFDLKIRFYILNKDYKELLSSIAGSKQSSENGSVKNFNETKCKLSIKDKEIKILKAIQQQQLLALKNHYEEIIKNKDIELEDLKMEKTSAYVTELELNAATLYETIEQKDQECIILKRVLENQKDEIKKLKDDLKTVTNNLNNKDLNEELNNNLINKSIDQNNQTTEMYKLSLKETRKELDQIKFELKNQKIMEKEKLDNYAKLLTEKEVENELLKEKILNLRERENYLQEEIELLQKDNDLLKENEEQFINEINQLKVKEDHLFKENQEYEIRIKEDYLIKQNFLKEKNQSEVDSIKNKKLDENSNLIANSNSFQNLINYAKSLQDKLEFQDDIIRNNDLEKHQLLLKIQSLLEKKRNLENTISKQLAKTNYLLATAKQNLIDK